jgi:hypothetical protein
MAATPSLAEQATAVKAVVRAAGGRLRPPPEILAVSLVQFFDYNVTKGGFAQLIYNSRGEYLQEIEQALALANAAIAGEFYKRAILLCAENPDEFGKFLRGAFTDESPLKNSLHGLSIEYFRREQPFDAEIEAFVHTSAERVSGWVQEHAQGAG